MTGGGVDVRIADWGKDENALRAVRRRVFVEEQQVPERIEWDGRDTASVHLIARDRYGAVIGTARLLPNGQIGRMAVLPERRGFGVGRALLEAAVEAARARGDVEVHLNAQTHARGFYEALGFIAVGRVFEEAGIPHLRMERALEISFIAPKDPGSLQIVNAEVDRAPYELPALLDCPDAVRTLAGESAIEAAVNEVAGHARRELLVLSPDLDPRYFDSRTFRSLVSRFARRHGNASFRVLVHDTRRMVRDGHGLLELSRRLPSSISIRVVHPDMQDREDTLVIADRTGLISVPRSAIPSGFLNLNDAPLARQHVNLFNRLHDRSVSDPNLRQMSI